jgi:hypothetical protein
MNRSYFVFGTRYSGWDKIYCWIKRHQKAYCYDVGYKQFCNGTFQENLNDHTYYNFAETSLVHHEDIMLTTNKGLYTKTIIVLNDIEDVIEEILHKTRKSVEDVVNNQVELLEELIEEAKGETHYIPERSKLVILYDQWLKDEEYRNWIAELLGFVNTNHETYHKVIDYKLRDSYRYKYFITDRIRNLEL